MLWVPSVVVVVVVAGVAVVVVVAGVAVEVLGIVGLLAGLVLVGKLLLGVVGIVVGVACEKGSYFAACVVSFHQQQPLHFGLPSAFA